MKMCFFISEKSKFIGKKPDSNLVFFSELKKQKDLFILVPAWIPPVAINLPNNEFF